MNELIEPVLKENSFIAFVSPSAGLAGIYEYRVKRAIKWFEKNGFKVKLGKNCLKKGYIAGKPEERAEDINEMIYDKDVSAIISTIGGDHSIQILKYIDFKGFRKNPKVFVGFSDITVLHLAFYKISKVQTFYGPMVNLKLLPGIYQIVTYKKFLFFKFSIKNEIIILLCDKEINLY